MMSLEDLMQPKESCSQKEHDQESGSNTPVNEVMSRSEVRVSPLWRGEGASDKAPAYTLKKERLEHRVIAVLKAEGCNNTEIATQLGMSPVTINYVVRQPWFQQMVLEMTHKSGDVAMELLHKTALLAAQKLEGIIKDPEVNKETLRKACNDVLDRKFGKPNQPYTTQRVDPSKMSDGELEKLIAGAQGHN